MDFSTEHIFTAPLDTVWAMFCDPSAHVRKYEWMGHRDVEVIESEIGETSLHLVVRRQVDVDLPGYARKVLKPTNTVTTTDDWTRAEDDTCTGTQQVETKGAPVQISGETRLNPHGLGTLYRVKVHLDVKVPLIGGKLSNWAKGTVSQQLEQEFLAGERWLSGER